MINHFPVILFPSRYIKIREKKNKVKKFLYQPISIDKSYCLNCIKNITAHGIITFAN